FSTTTAWPDLAVMWSAATRAAMSVMPPADTGTMMRIGRAGKSSAARATMAASTTAAIDKPSVFMPCAENSLFRHDGRDADLDDHARPCELVDVEKRVSRQRIVAERLHAALAIVGLIADVGDIGDHLDHVA